MISFKGLGFRVQGRLLLKLWSPSTLVKYRRSQYFGYIRVYKEGSVRNLGSLLLRCFEFDI